MIGIFVASSSQGQDHLYDFTPVVENGQQITRHITGRQGEGSEERYQCREQNKREKRNGCLDTYVPPRVPTHYQQRQQSLNHGSSAGDETIVNTGTVKINSIFHRIIPVQFYSFT